MAKIRRLTSKDYVHSTWSGGETTQICLFPPEGHYEIGQFDFRISTASVLLEKSNFTALPHYQRIIMSLDQPLTLIHKNNKGRIREVELQPFEADYFDGADETISIGQCQDFNLMYAQPYEGMMQVVRSGNKRRIESNGLYCLYFLEDCEVEIWGLEEAKVLSCASGNSLIIESKPEESGYVIVKEPIPFREPIAVEVTVKKVEDVHWVKGD